jgi:hypothetical protein
VCLVEFEGQFGGQFAERGGGAFGGECGLGGVELFFERGVLVGEVLGRRRRGVLGFDAGLLVGDGSGVVVDDVAAQAGFGDQFGDGELAGGRPERGTGQ